MKWEGRRKGQLEEYWPQGTLSSSQIINQPDTIWNRSRTPGSLVQRPAELILCDCSGIRY